MTHAGAVTIRAVRDRHDLERVVPGDVFARLDPPREVDGWVGVAAAAYVRASARRAPSLTVWGPGAATLAGEVLRGRSAAGARVRGLTLPRAVGDAVRSGGSTGTPGATDAAAEDAADAIASAGARLGAGADWDWMWTDVVPDSVPGEERLVPLDDVADAAEIQAFGARINPRFEGFPGTGHSEGWLAHRDAAGDLRACGTIQRLPSGVAHLGGIVVDPALRGTGLGRAVGSALTRRVVAAEGVCTLGVYADNAAAVGLYRSLGYLTDKAWHSVTLRRAS